MDDMPNPALPGAPGHPNAQDKAPHEVELKLRGTPAMLDKLRQAPVITQHARNQGIVRRLEAVYYDTPDCLLDRHGISLRVRRSGQRHIQTLKRAASGDNPLARQEWETPVDDEHIDLSRFPVAEIGAPLDGLRAEVLRPVFSSKVRRRIQKVQFDSALVEIAFDEGVIAAGERSEKLSEIELELKAGDAAILYEIGLSLLDLAPLQVETATKAARGYKLARNTEFKAAKAEPVAITAEDNVDAAIAKILGNGQHQLMANLAPVEFGDNPEGVHQMRVSLRRLRTALTLIRRELGPTALGPVAEEARRLARVLGPARNWDVFATDTLADIEKAGLPDIDIAGLRNAAEPFRAESYVVVREMLAGSQTNRFLLSFGRLLERRGWRNGVASEAMTVLAEPVKSFARRVLTRSHRKSLKRGRHFKQLSPEARHELRLSLKKLRYTSEFFLPLYADVPAAGKYLKRLSQLQDVLGAANDAATTQPLLDTLRRGTSAPELHYSIGAVIGWQRREQVEAAKGLLKRWRKFEATTPFWA
ncbi:inorganic triphosphatase YgiF [Bosea sp. BK604]|nr:inorganic triphosphatase YgiF [Bosea sp. BK604]